MCDLSDVLLALRRAASVALLAFLLGCSPDPSKQTGTILFVTDFGVVDGAVAVCKAVMWGIAPELRIVDVTHQIPPYDIETAGEVLEQALELYPAGTVAVAVVDPGVGGERKNIAARTNKGHLLVGPDNGIFTLVLESEGLDRAVELRNQRYLRPGEASYTFHGRDIFSPAAAHLAAGVPLDSLGPSVVPMRLDVRPATMSGDAVSGIVRYVEDPYGNVVTNIPPPLLESLGVRSGDTLLVRIGARSLRLPWRRTFSDVAKGQALAVIHERGLLSFSINQDDFAAAYGVKRRDSVVVRRVR